MKTIIRFSIYFVVLAVLTALAMLIITKCSFAAMKENNIIEWLEALWLVLSSLFLFFASRKSGEYAQLFAVLWLVPLIAAVRELDAVLDDAVFHGSWAIPAGCIVLLILYRILKSADILKSQILSFAQTQQAVFLGMGFFIVVIFAQICGQKEIMRAIMQDNFNRNASRFLEETIEFLGYMIIVIGSAECLFNSQKRHVSIRMDDLITKSKLAG